MFHMRIRDCPGNLENKKEEEEPRDLTFATIPESVTKECMELGIIDTGCTMTVARHPSFLAMARKFTVDEMSRYLL